MSAKDVKYHVSDPESLKITIHHSLVYARVLQTLLLFLGAIYYYSASLSNPKYMYVRITFLVKNYFVLI